MFWKTIMFLNSQKPARSRGRPQLRPDTETIELLVEAAEQAFQTHGYAGASMCDMARQAGVSTKTLYRLIPHKADLFREVVSRRMGRYMLAFAAEAHDVCELRRALAGLLVAYGELSLSKETVAVHALVVAEGRRFPELADLFNTQIRRGAEAMTAWLSRHKQRGLLRLDDVAQASGMLRGMMSMEPQRAIMLGQREPPDAAELAARAERCADLFLGGCLGVLQK